MRKVAILRSVGILITCSFRLMLSFEKVLNSSPLVENNDSTHDSSIRLSIGKVKSSVDHRSNVSCSFSLHHFTILLR